MSCPIIFCCGCGRVLTHYPKPADSAPQAFAPSSSDLRHQIRKIWLRLLQLEVSGAVTSAESTLLEGCRALLREMEQGRREWR